VEIIYHHCVILDSQNNLVQEFRTDPENPKQDYEGAKSYLLGAGAVVNDKSVKRLLTYWTRNPKIAARWLPGKLLPESLLVELRPESA